MTRRDRSIRHALDKLVIVERYAREARAVLAGDSYDDVQLAAIRVVCQTCGRTYAMTHPSTQCASCR